MKISINHLNSFLENEYETKIISDALFKLGHEHSFENSMIIDLDITPNRGDCLSVLGIARDLNSCLNAKNIDFETTKFECNTSRGAPTVCYAVALLCLMSTLMVFFEDGIGMFVEPIKVRSINVELEPSISLRYKVFSGFSVFGGLSHSSIWTDDTFQAGSWRLKEQLNFGNLYNFLGIQYEISRLDLSLEAKLISSKDLTSYSIRLLKKVSLPVNVFK